MKSLVLIGNGGHCKSCIEIIETSKEFQNKGDSGSSRGSNKRIYEL